MTRPRYESRRDREVERDIVDAFCEAYGLSYDRQEDRRRVNYFCYRGDRLELILEVKRRYNDRDAYSTVFIPLAKWEAGCRLSSEYGVAYAVLIKWNDFTGMFSNRFGTYDSEGIGGRRDRGDSKDIERMAYFRVSRFKSVRAG